MMAFSASMKLSHAPPFMDLWVNKFGYAQSSATGIGLIELSCAVLYVIPRTAVLGAVLMAGYLGGAVATHVRIGDPGFMTPLVLGIMAWAGLYLREGRLRACCRCARSERSLRGALRIAHALVSGSVRSNRPGALAVPCRDLSWPNGVASTSRQSRFASLRHATALLDGAARRDALLFYAVRQGRAPNSSPTGEPAEGPGAP